MLRDAVASNGCRISLAMLLSRSRSKSYSTSIPLRILRTSGVEIQAAQLSAIRDIRRANRTKDESSEKRLRQAIELRERETLS
jgi:hypothetical protein